MMSPESLASLRQAAHVRAQVRICGTERSKCGTSLMVVARYVRVFSGFLLGACPGRTIRYRLPLATPIGAGLPMPEVDASTPTMRAAAH